MKHLDLFSGIGGFALAAKWCGMDTIAFCEIDKDARASLLKNFPNVPIFKDVRSLHAADLPSPPDVITGGYPCQPFSLTGLRRGEEDDRHLWPEIKRIIRELRSEGKQPTWCVFENVYGHLSMGLDQVLFDLEREGYSCWTFIVPACAVGAAHKRDRVWLVANSQREGWEGREPDNGIFGSEKEAHTEFSDCLSGTWDEMDRRSRGLRSSDGISVKVVRAECKGYGNAIVPQVAYEILRCLGT